VIALGATIAWSGGCRARPAPTAPHAGDPRPLALPDRIPPFSGSALVQDPAFIRRTYGRGSARITVTLARYPMEANQYDDWVKMSTAGYPQAALGLPSSSGNGFYECAAGGRPPCSLLIQLRAGIHIEIRGEGDGATREDVDLIARGLPLATLAAP
jgi:hypothetical protein